MQWGISGPIELGRCVYALPCKGAQDQHIESMTSKESMTSLKQNIRRQDLGA